LTTSLTGVFYPFIYTFISTAVVFHLHRGRVPSPPRSCSISTAVVFRLHRGRVPSPPRSRSVSTAVAFRLHRGRVSSSLRSCSIPTAVVFHLHCGRVSLYINISLFLRINFLILTCFCILCITIMSF
jgi:hypothetical protein